MKELEILYLYPDILELYGDFGNIQVLKYRLEQRGITATIVPYSIGDNAPNFSDYDLVFAGGGADQEQGILSEDLMKYKDNIKAKEKRHISIKVISVFVIALVLCVVAYFSGAKTKLEIFRHVLTLFLFVLISNSCVSARSYTINVLAKGYALRPIA